MLFRDGKAIEPGQISAHFLRRKESGWFHASCKPGHSRKQCWPDFRLHTPCNLSHEQLLFFDVFYVKLGFSSCTRACFASIPKYPSSFEVRCLNAWHILVQMCLTHARVTMNSLIGQHVQRMPLQKIAMPGFLEVTYLHHVSAVLRHGFCSDSELLISPHLLRKKHVHESMYGQLFSMPLWRHCTYLAIWSLSSLCFMYYIIYYTIYIYIDGIEARENAIWCHLYVHKYSMIMFRLWMTNKQK